MSRLERFVEAQNPVIETALTELRASQKRTHWMWFVFPQLRALGRSERAMFYGLADLSEAEAYLVHPVLGPRLIHCTEAAMTGHKKTAFEIFGSPDDLKFRSCMTLFGRCGDAPEIFETALGLSFDGPDERTLSLIAAG